MHNGKVNKTRYDDSGKLMKQTSFTVKNLGGNRPAHLLAKYAQEICFLD